MITIDQAGAGKAFLRTRPATASLRSMVAFSWVQGPTPAPPGSSWRVVPDLCPHLIHHRDVDGRTTSMLVGARSVYVDVCQSTRRFTVGVRLSPGALPALLRDSAWVLRDGALPIGEALGADGRRAAARLDAETDPAAVERILLELVRSRAKPREIDWRVAGLVTLVAGPRPGTAPRDPVRHAARQLGVSDRSLRDVSRRAVGLRPKEAHRIARLHRALHLSLAGTSDAGAAHASGFSDQAHWIRESRTLLGDTPGAFRARADSFKTPHTPAP